MSQAAVARLEAAGEPRKRKRPAILLALVGLAAATMFLALTIGAVSVPPRELLGMVLARVGFTSTGIDASHAEVIWNIRAPRVILGAVVGAALATSGAAMQGLFRNPLADPALLGVSSGASLAAVTVIVASAAAFGSLSASAAAWLLPLAAFGGGLAATWASVAIARVQGRPRPSVMLLAGVAINALAGAGIGFAMHVANDAQLRSITFWTLGSLGGATWRLLAVVGPVMLIGVGLLHRFARQLNALLLGDREATHLGVDARATQRGVIGLTALVVGAAVATTGVVGFVGLVVPHAARFAVGADHRRLLSASALIGATLLVAADTLARVVVAPAELPVGVLTAAIGAPLFIARLARARDAAVFG